MLISRLECNCVSVAPAPLLPVQALLQRFRILQLDKLEGVLEEGVLQALAPPLGLDGHDLMS